MIDPKDKSLIITGVANGFEVRNQGTVMAWKDVFVFEDFDRMVQHLRKEFLQKEADASCQ